MCSCVTVIRHTVHRAKKERYCGLAEYVYNTEFPKGMIFSELRSIAIYKQNGRRIMPGDTYISQFNKHEGYAYTWLAKKDIYDLLCKYDLFPCEC